MSLFQRSKELFAAFAVATIGLGAPAALANDTQSEPTAQSVAYAQEYATLSSEDALAQSNGRVLLHVGEGYSPVDLQASINLLEAAQLEVDVAYGGPENGITSYFYGNHYPPRIYTSETSDEMLYTIIQAARQLNLIPPASDEIELARN